MKEIREKITDILENYEHGDKIIKSWTCSSTNHKKVEESVITDWLDDEEKVRNVMESYIEDLDKYGELEGADSKGYWIKIIDFKLVKEEERTMNDYKETLGYIERSINAEIASRNHMDMTEKEKGIMEGLILAAKIFRGSTSK